MQLKDSHSVEINELNNKIESLNSIIRNNLNMNPNNIQEQLDKCKQCQSKDAEISELKFKLYEWQEQLKNMSINNQ